MGSRKLGAESYEQYIAEWTAVFAERINLQR